MKNFSFCVLLVLLISNCNFSEDRKSMKRKLEDNNSNNVNNPPLKKRRLNNNNLPKIDNISSSNLDNQSNKADKQTPEKKNYLPFPDKSNINEICKSTSSDNSKLEENFSEKNKNLINTQENELNSKTIKHQNSINKIEISEYNSEWPKFYEKEANLIKEGLKDECINVYHIGSTSVPNLAAKSIIDILLVVKDINSVKEQLQKINYKYKGEYNIPLRPFYSKEGKFKIYLHVHEQGSSEIELNLKFRNYLRQNSSMRIEYEKVKKNSASDEDSTNKTTTGITFYNLKKNTIINKILKAADFKGLCPRYCTQDVEWEIYDKIRKLKMNDNFQQIDKNDELNKHLILYEGIEIVAASNLDLSIPQKVKVIFREIDKEKGNQSHLEFLENFTKKYALRNNLDMI